MNIGLEASFPGPIVINLAPLIKEYYIDIRDEGCDAENLQ
jgi:hypothetical protein